MDTNKKMLIDMTFCILGKLYDSYKKKEIDFDTFSDHAKIKIRFLNEIINNL